MKSSNTSFSTLRRRLIAAAVVLATGSLATYGQTSSNQNTTSSSPNTSSSYNNQSSDTSRTSSSDMSNTSDTNRSTMSSGSSRSDKLSWTDRRFVTKAADSGQEEMQLAQLAAQKANNPDVRQFAQQLIDQHQQVNTQLMSIANTKNVKIDQEDTTKDRAYKRLSKASGNDFDREFVDHMIDQHEKDIKMFERAAKNAKDPEVKQFASTTLDQLRQHLNDVQRLQQSIMPTGRTDNESWKSSSPNQSGSSGSSSGNYNSGSSGTSGSSTSTTTTRR